MNAASASNITKVYGRGSTEVRALSDVSVTIPSGTFTAVMGPSGSGKSTLMHCLAGLDSVTSGEVMLGDTALKGMSDKQLTLLRRDQVGFIFQQFNLMATLSARENILLPLMLAKREPDPTWFDTVLDAVGLRDRLNHRPSELSGGQQQRVAVARALVGRPKVIFADEPTGNLDSHSGEEILTLMRRSVQEWGQTIVMVTHDAKAASRAERVLFLADGTLRSELTEVSVDAILETIKGLEGPA